MHMKMQGLPHHSWCPVISWITLPNPDHQPTMPQSRSLILKSSLCPEAVVALVDRPPCCRSRSTLRATANRKNWGLFRGRPHAGHASPAAARVPAFSCKCTLQLLHGAHRRLLRLSQSSEREPCLGSGEGGRERWMMKRCRYCRFAPCLPLPLPPGTE